MDARIIDYILAVCYFLGIVTAIFKAVRYTVDWKRRDQWFYLIGLPANIALAIAMAILVITAGPDPIFRGPSMVIALRTAIMTWAIWSVIFEILYARKWLILRRKDADSS